MAGKQDLIRAIDKAFSKDRVSSTLRNSVYGLGDWRLNLGSLNESLPAGPIPVGSGVPINFQLEFNTLSPTGQSEVEIYYKQRVQALPLSLRDEYPQAFKGL